MESEGWIILRTSLVFLLKDVFFHINTSSKHLGHQRAIRITWTTKQKHNHYSIYILKQSVLEHSESKTEG